MGGGGGIGAAKKDDDANDGGTGAAKKDDTNVRRMGLNSVCDWTNVLSAGEKQRVAFARFFFPPVFYFSFSTCGKKKREQNGGA